MNEHDIAVEIADILSLDVDTTLQAVEDEATHPGSHVKSAWLATNPSSDEQIEHFYSDTQAYIFDLMTESAREVRQQWRAAVVEALNQKWGDAKEARVLDYGAGVGSDTLYFAEKCRTAFYYDLPGSTSDFATKRFARCGATIPIIASTSKYDSAFDAIVSFEVLEHLVDPLAHLDELVRLTKHGGMVFLTESFGLINENYPSHLPRHQHLDGKLDELMIERGCRPVSLLEGRIHTYVKGPAVTVIVPIYNAYDHVRRLLSSISLTIPGYPVRWMLVNDASPDSRIRDLLHEFEASFDGKCQIVDRADNLGFLKTCNAAMVDAGTDDVILLNSDTVVYDAWARRLLQAAYEEPDIGTATPLSNNASCYSLFQYVAADNRVNAMLAEAEQPSLPIPVGVGFCIYIKRELLDRVGMFDTVFGKGYGEETDLCLRASAAGYRHVLATQTFIHHAGSVSMAAANVVRAGETTIEEHELIIAKRYPKFVPSVHEFIGSRVIEALESDLGKYYVTHESGLRPSIAIVVHDDLFAAVVGGTTYHIRDLIQELQHDFVFYVITPAATQVRVTSFVDGIVHAITLGNDDYARMLVELNPSIIHIHHLMNFPPSFINALIDWQGQKIYTIHDYYGVCPQYNLVNYRQVYCGVPEPDECDRCAMKLFGTGFSTVDTQRRIFQRLVDSVSTVVAPSRAALDVFRKAISVPPEKSRVIQHPMVSHKYGSSANRLLASPEKPVPSVLDVADNDHTKLSKNTPSRASNHKSLAKSLADLNKEAAAKEKASLFRLEKANLRVGFVGYNSPHKGTALLQGIVTACSADPIMFVALGDIGKAIEDRKNIITTSLYRREEAVSLIKKYLLDVVIVTSNWPETFCYTVSEAWMAGVPVIVGPLGAPAERVAETGAGLVMSDSRVQSFVAAVHNLLTDQDQLTQLKRAASAVSPRQDYGQYRDLYGQLVHRGPTSTRFFASSIQQVVKGGAVDVNQVPAIAKLVDLRKRVFPLGSARERVYFWMHNRISRTYAGGLIR